MRVEVRDTGAGLSQAALARVFTPFYTTKNDGNGLGLWISLGLVERYGGSIRAGNRRDRGDDSPGAVFAVDLLCEAVTDTGELVQACINLGKTPGTPDAHHGG